MVKIKRYVFFTYLFLCDICFIYYTIQAMKINTTKRSIYLLLFLISMVVYMFQKLNIALPKLINNYLNDGIAMLLILKIVDVVVYNIYQKQLARNIKYVIGIVIYFSFIFEYLYPMFHSRYTADWWDVLVYFIGAIVFLIIENYDYKKMFTMWRIYR